MTKEIHGQDQAIRALSVRGLLHLKRSQKLQAGQNVGKNECVYFAGPSGCGKTFSAQVFGQITGLPHTIFDCSTATQTGYVGTSVVEDGCRALIRSAGDPQKPETLAKARYGVLVYDEVSKKKTRQGVGLDVSSNSVQAEFLRLMEGSSIILGTHYVDRMTKPGEFNSNGTMFIFAGMLQDFDQVILRLSKRKNGIGFHGDTGVKQGSYLYDAMVEYGFIPEFINRLSAIVPFQPLSMPALCNIILKVVGDYNQLFADDGLKISLSSKGVNDIAEYCSGDLQARGAKLVISALIEPIIYEGGKGEIEIPDGTVSAALEHLGSVEGFA